MSAARIGRVRYKEFHVSPELLAQFAVGGGGALAQTGPVFKSAKDVWKMPKPMPGVVPETLAADAVMANDWNDGLYSNMSQLGMSENVGFLSLQYLAQLTQRQEYRRPVEIIAKNMTRKWIKFGSAGKGNKDKKIKQLKAAFERYQVQSVFRRALEYDGTYGRAHIYIDTGDTDNAVELNTPLSLHAGKISKGGLKAIRAVDPMWAWPTDYETRDPLHEDFYRPRRWFVNTRPIHRTRFLTLVSREVSPILKPAYAFGGVSLTQLLKPYVDKWLRTQASVSELIHTFSTMILETQMGQALSGGSAGNLQGRLALYNIIRDNRGILAIQHGQEELKNISTPLGTLDSLQAQAQEHQASCDGIPLAIRFGIQPQGLNATSEGEIRIFYDWCHSEQEHTVRDPLTHVSNVIQMSEFGEIDPDITIDFEPLWQLDEAGIAGVQKTKADFLAVCAEAGFVTTDEARTTLAEDEQSPFHNISGSAPPPPQPLDPSGETDPAASTSSEQTVATASEKGKQTGENDGS